MLTMQERDECREIQDRFIAAVKRFNPTITAHEHVWYQPAINLHDYETTLYPELLPIAKEILSHYE